MKLSDQAWSVGTKFSGISEARGKFIMELRQDFDPADVPDKIAVTTTFIATGDVDDLNLPSASLLGVDLQLVEPEVVAPPADLDPFGEAAPAPVMPDDPGEFAENVVEQMGLDTTPEEPSPNDEDPLDLCKDLDTQVAKEPTAPIEEEDPMAPKSGAIVDLEKAQDMIYNELKRQGGTRRKTTLVKNIADRALDIAGCSQEQLVSIIDSDKNLVEGAGKMLSFAEGFVWGDEAEAPTKPAEEPVAEAVVANGNDKDIADAARVFVKALTHLISVVAAETRPT